MEVIQVIKENFFGFDFVIFIVAIFNAVIYIFAHNYTTRLYKLLHMVVYVPSRKRDPEKIAKAISRIDEEEVASLRKQSESFYSIFMNITAIFPLLGILGTVISLLPMVSDMANMETNFFAALTSTFWGLVFAIIFKLLDGFLASKIEDNDKSTTLFMERKIYMADSLNEEAGK